MKKFFSIIIVLVMILMVTGCSNVNSEASASANNEEVSATSSSLVAVQEWETVYDARETYSKVVTHHQILVDTETRVMYYSTTSTTPSSNVRSGPIDVTFDLLVDEDGSPRIYEGDI